MTLYACWEFDKEAAIPSGTAPSANDLNSLYNSLSGYTTENKLSYTKLTEMEVSDNEVNSADPLTSGYGVYIKLIQYDSTNNTETVIGTPILIYSGKLLETIVTRNQPDGGNTHISSGPSQVCIGPGCTDEYCRKNGLIKVDAGQFLETLIRSKVSYDAKKSTPIKGDNILAQVANLLLGTAGNFSYVFDTEVLVQTDVGLFTTNCNKSGSQSFFENLYYYDNDDISYNTGNSKAPTIIKSSYNLKKLNLYSYVTNCLGSSTCEFGLTSPLTKDKLTNILSMDQ
jgi:hypothetical protein